MCGGFQTLIQVEAKSPRPNLFRQAQKHANQAVANSLRHSAEQQFCLFGRWRPNVFGQLLSTLKNSKQEKRAKLISFEIGFFENEKRKYSRPFRNFKLNPQKTKFIKIRGEIENDLETKNRLPGAYRAACFRKSKITNRHSAVAYASIGGQVHTRFRSPNAWSILPVVAQNLKPWRR